jgi:H+/Na+-translocating ferredoxin:NAD+ oxidoreductase subunit B
MEPANPLAERIDELLPQTQCGRCGYAACRPYAEAIAAGEADINRCPPGGDETIGGLARLLKRDTIALDASRGAPRPLHVARIVEADCIGCTLCIAACPVDAIVGAQKRMHAVLASLCSGCELCVPACPVDCITMARADRAWTAADAAGARQRYEARRARLAAARAQRLCEAEARAREAAINAAFARARARRGATRASP